MANSIDFDLLCAAPGLPACGQRLLPHRRAEAQDRVVSKLQAMRSHSVSAEGGTAAVLFDDEGDTVSPTYMDTVKGSDFLADQDVAEKLCTEISGEVYRWSTGGCRGPGGTTAG